MPQGRPGKAATPAWPLPSAPTPEHRAEQLAPQWTERLGLPERQDTAPAYGAAAVRGQGQVAPAEERSGGGAHGHAPEVGGGGGDDGERRRAGRQEGRPGEPKLAMERSSELSASVVGTLISGMVRSGLSAFGRAVASLPPLLRRTLRDAGSAGAPATAVPLHCLGWPSLQPCLTAITAVCVPLQVSVVWASHREVLLV